MLYPLDKLISALPWTSLYFPDYKRHNEITKGIMVSYSFKYILLPKAPNAIWPKQSLGQVWKTQAEEPSPCPEGCAVPSPKCWAPTLATGHLLMPSSHSPSHFTSGKSVLDLQLCLIFLLIKSISGRWGLGWEQHRQGVSAGRAHSHLPSGTFPLPGPWAVTRIQFTPRKTA